MIAHIATKVVVVSTGAAMQPSEMAKLVTSSASTQVLIFRAMIATSSVTTKTVNQIFRSKTAAMANTKTIRPNGSKKNNAKSSNWVTGPSAGFQAGQTLSQTSATAGVDAIIVIAIAQLRFSNPSSKAIAPALS